MIFVIKGINNLMNIQCRRCVCNVIRQHYIKTRPKEYKESISEWCELNQLDESIEWNNLIKHRDTTICSGISLFITKCFQ